MTLPKKKLMKIQKLKRHRYHVVLHHAHNAHRISYRTLYYIKSFGDDRHMWHAIVMQSFKVIILASILSTLGGLWLEGSHDKLLQFMPLVILLPALNTMIGNFGCIIGSKFATMLFTGRVEERWWRSDHVQSLVLSITVIGIISAIYIGILSTIIAALRGFPISDIVLIKVLSISLLCTALLIGVICLLAFVSGFYVFKKGEDPNNFVIPITTSLADFGSLLIFTWLALVLI